jgi:hypothetical protein
MKKIIFNLLAIFHVLVWMFVVFAFTNIKMAYYNLYYFIPFIYLVHILPFHILVKAKQTIYPKTYNKKLDEIEKLLVIPYYFNKCQAYLDKKCTFSLISPQGMMIFGALSSAFILKKNINIIKNI